MRNREQWLAAFASAAQPSIARQISGGGDEEAAIRLSCGFPPKTGRKAALAAVVPPTASQDFTAEIFVSPTVDQATEVAKSIIPLLQLAQSGNWRSAAPSVAKPLDTLPAWSLVILERLGSYPHAALEIAAAPKQTTRLNKAVCHGGAPSLGNSHEPYIVRISRNTAITHGTPICPICSAQLVLETN